MGGGSSYRSTPPGGSHQQRQRPRPRHRPGNGNSNGGGPTPPPVPPPVPVALFLLDASGDAGGDPSASRLLETLASDPSWALSCSAADFLGRGGGGGSVSICRSSNKTSCSNSTSNSNPTSDSNGNGIRSQVSRFLKTNDKYLAYASVLFKSRAFHNIYGGDRLRARSRGSRSQKENENENENENEPDPNEAAEAAPVPIVSLPRTGRGKPYVPLPGGSPAARPQAEPREEDAFPLSVSHQFPFVGMAELPREANTEAQGGISLAPAAHVVGLDIVVFEGFNRRLYSSAEEFLAVFEDQFTPSEWRQGVYHHHHHHHPGPAGAATTEATPAMREFYLRWAMKEAYTKAIGVGMGLAFGSFEIRLEGIEGCGDGPFSLSARLFGARKGGSNAEPPKQPQPQQEPQQEPQKEPQPPKRHGCEGFRGRVHFPGRPRTDDEGVWFGFLPLRSGAAEGCACVCVCEGTPRETGGEFRNHSSTKTAAATATTATRSGGAGIAVSWTDLEALARFHKEGGDPGDCPA